MIYTDQVKLYLVVPAVHGSHNGNVYLCLTNDD